MWNLSKLLSAFWGILGLLTLITLFIVYANFPDYSSLDFLGVDGEVQLDRHRFFFIFSGLYLVVNMITYTAIKTAGSLRRRTKSLQSTQHLRTLVGLKILIIGANLFLITLMIFTRSAIEMQSLTGIWHWPILWIGPLAMVSGLIYIVYIMLFPAQDS